MTTKKKVKLITSVSLDEDTWKKMDELAEYYRASNSYIMMLALRAFYTNHENQS